ncbi:hypothetical protein [Streptomyces spiramyceticus]|nr:hypothetical protein [Streptomyces spiramyceticus]
MTRPKKTSQGAARVNTRPGRQPGGVHWTVLLDPSGQPFCISSTR